MSQYENVVEEGVDLVEAARRLQPTHFRDQEVEAVLEALGQNRSVLLVGPPGVGKSAILYAVALRLGVWGKKLRALTTSQIMSGTRYIGDWESKVTRLMTEAEQSGTVVNLVDVWNLAGAGTTSTNKACMLDAMRPRLADGRLRLISEVTAERLHDMHRVPNFTALFELVTVPPLSKDAMRDIIERQARAYDLALPPDARERLFQLCADFEPGDFGPGSALDLLERVRDYRIQKLGVGEPADATPQFVEKVFSIHSGLPSFVVSRAESKPAAAIRDWFRQRIIGQEAAIDAVVEMITFYKARLHDKSKPIGSFLFVGPTGVGKTELARALAEFFFGSEKRMLRFDMSEFADYNSFELLIGSPSARERPARLTDPVRAQPFQVLLFDELEKAHRNIQDLFLQLLDEGRLTTPLGETVGFCSTVIVATSNVGATEAVRSGIGFGASPDEAYDTDRALKAVEAHFRPEFLNRFQHVVLFHPLTRDQAVRIARAEIRSVLKADGISDQNLVVDVHDDVIDHVLDAGFNPRYGARGIKREIRRLVMLPIATLLMERPIAPGALIDVRVDRARVRVDIADTPDSEQFKEESIPVRTRSGERLSRQAVEDRVAAAGKAWEALAAAAEVGRLRKEIDKIDAERKDFSFWRDADQASRILARQSQLLERVSRIDRLLDFYEELDTMLAFRPVRTQLEELADKLVRLEASLASARRELIVMEPDGHCDALVEIRPVGAGGEVRNLLFELYDKWAKDRRMTVAMLHEPMSADEPITIAVRGHFPYGYLKGEAGHHRVRNQRGGSVARVTVAPWSDRRAPVQFGAQRALKAVGQLGGKIRSRVELITSKLVLQNAGTLTENRELALEVAPCWPGEVAGAPPVVRRYDLNPFRVRDYLTHSDFARNDILEPKLFHELLCARVDARP